MIFRKVRYLFWISSFSVCLLAKIILLNENYFYKIWIFNYQSYNQYILRTYIVIFATITNVKINKIKYI